MHDDRRPNVEGHDLTEERPVSPDNEMDTVERESIGRPRPRMHHGVERESAGAVEPEAHPDPAMQGTPQPDGDPGRGARPGHAHESRNPDLH